MIDPNDAIAAVHDAARSIDASTRQMAATLEALRQDAHGMHWLQGFTIALVGASIAFLGWVMWYSSIQHAKIAEILRLMQQH